MLYVNIWKVQSILIENLVFGTARHILNLPRNLPLVRYRQPLFGRLFSKIKILHNFNIKTSLELVSQRKIYLNYRERTLTNPL